MLKEENKQKLFAEADSLVDKILSCPRIKLPNSQTLILDGVETGVLLSGFPQHRRRKNTDVTDIYFTSFGSAGITPTLDLTQIAKTKKRGSWIPLKV